MQNNDHIQGQDARLNRRAFLALGAVSIALLTHGARASETSGDPWPERDLVQPADLASELRSGGDSARILCVTFPFLYRQKHLPHAQFAGPTSKPEGIAKLQEIVKGWPLETAMVVYCGCCPMTKCPNIRPAYRALKTGKFQNVRVLNLPTNLHTDWIAKGYPIET